MISRFFCCLCFVLFIFTACKGPNEPTDPPVIPEATETEEDGTITVHLTGAETYNGKNAIIVLFENGSNGYFWSSILAAIDNTIVISAGGFTSLMYEWDNRIVVFKGQGGQKYDIFGFIDTDDDYLPSPGDYEIGKTITVNGDMHIDYSFPSDFTEVTPATYSDGTISVNLSGADMFHGKKFYSIAYSYMTPSGTPMGGDNGDINVDGTCNCTILDSGTPLMFDGGGVYYIYCFIDVDNDTIISSGDFALIGDINDYMNELWNVTLKVNVVFNVVYPRDFISVP